MKTVLIYDQVDAPLEFFVLDGDYRHLNGVYINSYTEDEEAVAKIEELSKIVYDREGKKKLEVLDKFPSQAVRGGAEVIVAGFLP